EGLLPEDRPIEIPPAGSDLEEEDFLTDGDINANRIRTLLWNSAETSHSLESAYELTASQPYHWAVRAVNKAGQVQTKTAQFRTESVEATGGATFSGVTLISHGFQLPYFDDTTPLDFVQLGYLIADTNEGKVFKYVPDTGKWQEVDRDGKLLDFGADPASAAGKPLVLLSDWALDSSISDSGFSEAAADALFAALVKLNEDLGSNGLFNSPMHLVGFSRGTVVTSEIAQRLVTYFPDTIPDLQMTTLDPHDFNQTTLDVKLNTLLAFLQLLGNAPGAVANLLNLTGNNTLYFGDFLDPDVQVWQGVDFADNYWQAQAPAQA
ncbi:MAG: hypothetical protein GTO62_12180, partial [Planctomycetales bacterium]|nr:hypothetical protein [Planctomycetales bacterium]NIP70001.1 hypothetical protein [Planctomycetales bacterium]